MKKKLSMLIILFMSLFLISDVKAAAPSWLYTSFVAPYEDYGIKKDGNKVSVPIHFEQRKDVDYKLEYDKAIIKSVSLESDYLDYDKDTNKYIVNKEGKFAGYENDSYKDCYQFNNTVTGNLIIEFNDIKTITSDIKIKILSDKGLIEKAPHNGNYNSSKVNCSNSTIDQFTKNEKEIIISSDLIKNSSTLEVTEETSNVDSNTTLKNITVNNTKVSIKIIKENEQYKMIYPTNHINKSLKYSIIVNNEKVFSYPNIKESYNLENDYTIAGVGASAKEQKYTNQDNIKIVFESFDGSIKKEISINSNYR